MTAQSSVRESIFNRWLWVTFYGWMLGFVAIVILALLGEAIRLGGSQFFVGFGAGLGIGFNQALYLKKKFGTGWWWMWGSALGMGLSFTFFDFGSRVSDQLPQFNLYYSVIGGSLLSSLFQFRVLRNITDRYAWWIPISLSGWMVVTAVIYLNDYVRNLGPLNPVTATIGMALVIFGPGLIYGLITAVGIPDRFAIVAQE